MILKILYDNEVKKKDLEADWGFSCLIEGECMPGILFDTGASGPLLLSNMKKMGIDAGSIDIIVISHAHWDHLGGLSDLLELNSKARVYLPATLAEYATEDGTITAVSEPLQICQNVYSTGELMSIEQSLILNTEKGIVVVSGCSHPEVHRILSIASRFGQVYGIVGGLHGFDDFELASRLSLICPCQ